MLLAFAPCRLRVSIALACLVLTAGCVTNPDKATTLVQPKTPIAKTLTNFSQAKRCMDKLFQDAGISGLPITSDNIRDATQTVNLSTEDMIITAIDDMSSRSKAFSYFTISGPGSSANTIQAIYTNPAQLNPATVPDMFIRGSISQSDNSVVADSAGGAVTVPWVSIGADKEQVADTISIDLQVVGMRTYSVIQGVTTSNTITIVSQAEGKNARGLINSGSFGAGLSVSLSSRQREGRSQAVRTLMEYSLIELLGKLTAVPYTRCLELPSTDPRSMQFARDLYDQLTPEERIKRVQEALRRIGIYSGPVDGRLSSSLQAAVTQAKVERDLVPNGRVDFQIFNTLFNENLISNSPVWEASASTAATFEGRMPVDGRDPVGFSMDLLTQRPLARGDEMRVKLSVAKAADVYCYYDFVKDRAVQTVRIFPNRFQADNRLHAGDSIVVPEPGSRLRIVLNGAEEQAIACIATQSSYPAGEPDVVTQADLEPLRCGWSGVDCPVDQHQRVDTLKTSVRTVTFREGT